MGNVIRSSSYCWGHLWRDKIHQRYIKAYERLQDLENKYVEKIYKSLPKEEAKRFKNAMRNAGVRDARNDQKNGVESLGETYVKGNNIEGHHKTRYLKIFLNHLILETSNLCLGKTIKNYITQISNY